MTRSDFLLQFWKRVLKPIILAVVIYYVIQLLFALLSEEGPGRLLITIALFATLVLLALELANLFLVQLKKRLYDPLPKTAKRAFRLINTISQYLFLVALVLLVCYSLYDKSITEILFLSLVLTADKIYFLLTTKSGKPG
jgi:hypothetical protein